MCGIAGKVRADGGPVDRCVIERMCDAHSSELSRQAGELHARLHYGRTDEIIRFGLHEYLVDFLDRIAALGSEVSRVFLVPTY